MQYCPCQVRPPPGTGAHLGRMSPENGVQAQAAAASPWGSRRSIALVKDSSRHYHWRVERYLGMCNCSKEKDFPVDNLHSYGPRTDQLLCHAPSGVRYCPVRVKCCVQCRRFARPDCRRITCTGTDAYENWILGRQGHRSTVSHPLWRNVLEQQDRVF